MCWTSYEPTVVSNVMKIIVRIYDKKMHIKKHSMVLCDIILTT
jgi:hypothetical protein